MNQSTRSSFIVLLELDAIEPTTEGFHEAFQFFNERAQRQKGTQPAHSSCPEILSPQAVKERDTIEKIRNRYLEKPAFEQHSLDYVKAMVYLHLSLVNITDLANVRTNKVSQKRHLFAYMLKQLEEHLDYMEKVFLMDNPS